MAKKPKPALPPLPPLPENRSPFQLRKYARQHPDRCWFGRMESGEWVLTVDCAEVVRTSARMVDEDEIELAPGEYLIDLRDDELDDYSDPPPRQVQRELFT